MISQKVYNDDKNFLRIVILLVSYSLIGGLILSNVQSLCRKYTNLSARDIEKLLELEATLAYYAELTDCYMFIDCMLENLPHAIVVAEAFPKKEIGLYEKSVIGKFVFESFEPAVFGAFKHKEKSSISRAVTQEGITVEQYVVPILNVRLTSDCSVNSGKNGEDANNTKG